MRWDGSFGGQADSCNAAMTKRCPHSGRPAAYKARVVISSQSFGAEPGGRVPERRLPCRGFKQGQLGETPAIVSNGISTIGIPPRSSSLQRRVRLTICGAPRRYFHSLSVL